MGLTVGHAIAVLSLEAWAPVAAAQEQGAFIEGVLDSAGLR